MAMTHEALHQLVRSALADPSAPGHQPWSVGAARFAAWCALSLRAGEAGAPFRQGVAARGALSLLCGTAAECDALTARRDDLFPREPRGPVCFPLDASPRTDAARLATLNVGPDRAFSRAGSVGEPLVLPSSKVVEKAHSVEQLVTLVKRLGEAKDPEVTRADLERLRLFFGVVSAGLYPTKIDAFASFMSTGTDEDRFYKKDIGGASFADLSPDELFEVLYGVLTGGMLLDDGPGTTTRVAGVIPFYEEPVPPLEGWFNHPVFPPPMLFHSSAEVEALLKPAAKATTKKAAKVAIAAVDDSTPTAVLVFGRVFEGASWEQAAALSVAVEKLGKRKAVPLVLVPAGDNVVIGVELERTEADLGTQGKPSGTKKELTAKRLAQAPAALAEVSKALWKLAKDSGLVPVEDEEEKVVEGVLLTACGPLASASALVGKKRFQASAEGAPWVLVPATATVTLRAQYD